MNITKTLVLSATLAALSVGAVATPLATPKLHNAPIAKEMAMTATTMPFMGVEVHGGTAMLTTEKGKTWVKLSDDFMIPKAPAPSWQIVDKQGNVYLLKQLTLAGGKKNLSIQLPSYIKSVAKVQIWCSFAEVLLGEASFAKPVVLR